MFSRNWTFGSICLDWRMVGVAVHHLRVSVHCQAAGQREAVAGGGRHGAKAKSYITGDVHLSGGCEAVIHLGGIVCRHRHSRTLVAVDGLTPSCSTRLVRTARVILFGALPID